MTSISYPSEISGGCLCESVRYTIEFPDASTWPPYCSACQCTQCRKWLSSLHPIAINIPLKQFCLPSNDSKDASQLKVYESSPGCERAFCGKCGSGLTARIIEHMPNTVELAVGTLDEEVLIGKVKKGQEDAPEKEREYEGGWGKELINVKETLFWNRRIEGVTDGAGGGGKKWWGMIYEGESFE